MFVRRCKTKNYRFYYNMLYRAVDEERINRHHKTTNFKSIQRRSLLSVSVSNILIIHDKLFIGILYIFFLGLYCFHKIRPPCYKYIIPVQTTILFDEFVQK